MSRGLLVVSLSALLASCGASSVPCGEGGLVCQSPLVCVPRFIDCGPHCGCTHDSDCPSGQTCDPTTDCGKFCSGSLPGSD